MEDDNEQAGTPFRSVRSWMKSALTYTGFSFQSLLTRQILSAISGLLVNLLITPLVVRFIDDDFQSSSLKRALLISLVSMLLAFIFRYLIKLKRQNWYTSSRMDMDTAGCSEGMNPTGQQSSIDYSNFTSFRFPIPDSLQPNPQQLPVADDTAQVDNKLKSAPVSICSEPVRMSSSLSEHPPPPPPSYQPQWVTSKPTSSSSSNHRFSPSAPPSPMKGKGKLRTSRRTNRLKNMSPKATLLNQSLLKPTHTYQASKPLEPRLRKKEASSIILRKKVNKYIAGQASSSSLQLASWAWEFMEESSFAKFKREYAKFRSISSSSLGAFSTGIFRNEASWRNRGRAESDANQRKYAQVPREIENDHQLQKPAPAQAPAPLQAVTLEVNGGVRKKSEKGTKCGICLVTFLSSFCFQRPKRRWNSTRYRQIAHAPLLWSPSPIHPTTTTTITSPQTGCCI